MHDSIEGRLVINPSNKMEGLFRLIWKRNTRIYGRMNIMVFKDLTCRLNVSPTNRMEGVYNVQPLPRITKELKPVKDAFVTDKVPILNYGRYSELIVGYSEKDGETCRAFLKFNISELPKGMIITKASLILPSTYNRSSFSNLEISTISSDFLEYGVTWNSQPLRSKIVNIVDFPADESRVTIDFKDVVQKWYDQPRSNNGLMLRAFNEKTDQIRRFSSRESCNPPILQIEYLNPYVPLKGRSKIEGFMAVSRQEKSKLDVHMNIYSTTGKALLNGKLHVYNPEMLEGSLTVSAQYMSGRMGVMAVSGITAKIKTAYEGAPAYFRGKLLVSQTCCKGRISVSRVEKAKLESKIRVLGFGDYPVNGKMTISNPYLNGTLKVVSASKIIGNIKVVRREEDPGLKCNLYISYTSVLKSRLEVIITSDIPGQFKVQPIGEAPLYGKLMIVRQECEDLKGRAFIKSVSTLAASMQIQSYYFRAHMAVSVPGYKFLISCMDVKAVKDIKGNLKVLPVKTLQGHMNVETQWFKDLTCHISVDGSSTKGRRSYAFII